MRDKLRDNMDINVHAIEKEKKMTALEFEKNIIIDGWSLWRTKHNKKGELIWNIYQSNGFTLFLDVEGNMFLYDDDDPDNEFKACVTKKGDYDRFLATVRSYKKQRKTPFR